MSKLKFTVAVLQLLLPALLCLCLLQPAAGFFSFRERIPNGDKVPNPCEDGSLWSGVGHENSGGGGARNPFGRDFQAAGNRWTQELCRRDSDGDGRSNGEELGDPSCVWSEGAQPQRTDGITHPGVCPLDSATCTNSWDVCPKRFNCPSFKEEGVFSRDFRLKETRVPPKETTYMCQAFDLTSGNASLHMIGSVPILKNRNVIHHMIMYGCPERPPASMFDTPQSCFMGSHNCFEILNLWAFGIDGECFNEKAGVLVGGAGVRYALLEVHWNNPELSDSHVDSSGLTLYFTPELRQHHQGSLNYGELELVLPPLQPRVTYQHVCPAACTRAHHPEPRYLTSAMIHMHQFGARGRVSLWRNGRLVQDLLPDHDYDYDSPILRYFDPPVQYLPGDEIKTDCHFSTAGTNHSVFWGYDTSQEMCFSFINYYPNDVSKSPWDRLNVCNSMGGINFCHLRLPGPHVESECDVAQLRSGAAGRLALQQMKDLGCERIGCDPRCRSFLNETLWPSNACFDPRRSKRMAEAVATHAYLAEPSNRQQTVQDLRSLLYQQRDCEQEIRFLAERRHSAVTTSPPAPTQQPTKRPPILPPPHCERTITQHHLFVIIIVCVCLTFATGMLAMLVIALRIRKSSRIASIGDSQCEMVQPTAKG